ncbi:MAG: hypothetical protein IT555_11020 [Acetobacteraceae bacterium]|nr:hypothetical protein [Acetobacteraceae bacterium]
MLCSNALTRLAALSLAVAVASGGAGPARAQDAAAPLPRQTQLGSIPLASPRAAAAKAAVRMVRLTQMNGQEPMGDTRELACPGTGCQQLVSLMVDNAPLTFLVDVQFVTDGAYLSLQPRTAAVGAVTEFRQGRPGPVFIRGPATSTSEAQIAFVTAPPPSLRRLDTAVDGNTLASGNVFNRKRSPDLVLRVVVEPTKAP